MQETGFSEEERRLFQADGGLLCQSDPEATDGGLRPVEMEIAKDAGRRGATGEDTESGEGAWWVGAAAGGVKRKALSTSE